MLEIYKMLERMESVIGNNSRVSMSILPGVLILDVRWPGGKHFREAYSMSQMGKVIGYSSLEEMFIRHARSDEVAP